MKNSAESNEEWILTSVDHGGRRGVTKHSNASASLTHAASLIRQKMTLIELKGLNIRYDGAALHLLLKHYDKY